MDIKKYQTPNLSRKHSWTAHFGVLDSAYFHALKGLNNIAQGTGNATRTDRRLVCECLFALGYVVKRLRVTL